MMVAPVTDRKEGTAGSVKPAVNCGDAVAMLILHDNGTISECNEAFGDLFGYRVGIHVSSLLPQLSGIPLMRGEQINPRLRFQSHIGRQFEVVGLGGNRLGCELFFSEMEYLGRHYLRVLFCPVGLVMQ